MLDLVNPVRAGRRSVGSGWEAGFDEAGRAGTRQHGGLHRRSRPRIRVLYSRPFASRLVAAVCGRSFGAGGAILNELNSCERSSSRFRSFGLPTSRSGCSELRMARANWLDMTMPLSCWACWGAAWVAIAANRTRGPGNRAAAELLAIVLQNLSEFQPASRQ